MPKCPYSHLIIPFESQASFILCPKYIISSEEEGEKLQRLKEKVCDTSYYPYCLVFPILEEAKNNIEAADAIDIEQILDSISLKSE